MSDKWRKTAKQLMGQPVAVRHPNGQVTQGILRQADERGVYVQPMQSGRYASAMKQKAQITSAVATETDTSETAEPVFFAAWFLILYALIAGLVAFGAAGAYGGGYGRRFGGYGPGVRPYGAGPYARRGYF